MSNSLVTLEQAANKQPPTLSKNPSLDELEAVVRYEAYEGFVRAGKALELILQGRKFEERGYTTAKEYFASGTAPCGKAYGYQLIAAASLRLNMVKGTKSAWADSMWTEKALRPFTRIQPPSQGVRLAKEAQKIAKKEGLSEVTSKIANAVIAKHLGAMPATKKKRAKALAVADTPGEVVQFALDRINEMAETFEAFNASHWEDAEADSPGCVKRLAQALSDLASYLRS